MTTVRAALGARPWRAFERLRRRAYRTKLMQDARRRLGLVPPAIRRPIFLLGTVRSGTSFLARAIGAHPAVLLTGFELLREWVTYAEVEIAAPGLGCAHCRPAQGDGRSEHELAAMRQRFAALHVRKGGWRHTRFFNKNPHLWNKLSLVHRLFPDACYVVTSRDLVSTVASTKRLWEKMHRDWGIRYYLPPEADRCWSCAPPLTDRALEPARTFPGGDVAVLAEYWLRTYETIEAALAERDHVVAVRHAALVSNPRAALERVFAGLALPALPHHLPEAIQPRRNQRWREILRREEIDRLAQTCSLLAPRIARLTLAERGLALGDSPS